MPRLASRRLASRRLASRAVPGQGEAWVDTDPPSGATLGTMEAIAQEESIGCDILFTETAITVTTVSAEFRFENGTGRREALDFWPTRPTSGNKNIYGSILLLEPNTPYQIRARVNFSDGSHAYRVATAQTRLITTPDPTTLTPTRFVDPVNGNDAWTGTSATFVSGTTGPWKTYAKFASTYPSGSVVKFLSNGSPVYLTSDNQSLTRGAVTMITDAPAVADAVMTYASGPAVEVAAASGRVTIEPAAVTAPAGTSADPNYPWVVVAPWESVDVAGPGNYGNTPGTLYQVWRWVGCPVLEPRQGSYGATRSGRPGRIAHWRRDHAALATLADWAEALYTNIQYRFGFWTDGTGTVWARFPTLDGQPEVDPNTLWTWFGPELPGVDLIANSRISGFSVHTFAYPIQANGSTVTVDHCLARNGQKTIRITGTNSNTLVERNLIQDSNLWAEQSALVFDNRVIAWNIIKEPLIMADATTTVNKALAMSEVSAVYMTGSSRRAVIRHNTIEDGFNGCGVIGPGSNSALRTRGDNTDLYGNFLKRLSDDCFEPENTVINVRCWGNIIREVLSCISMGPLHYGPFYFWRNSCWEIGSVGVGRQTDNHTDPSGKAVKFSNDSQPGGRVYFIHNSFDIDQTDPNMVMWAGDSAGGSIRHERFWMKNNIITATSYIVDSQDLGQFTEDYNFLATSDVTRGFRVTPEGIDTPVDYDNVAGRTFEAYRTATGQGTNSNLVDAVTKQINAADWLADVRAMWADRDAGNLTLVTGAQAINRGTPIPNISDLPGSLYFGAAPDLGAFERE
jgi:hypothetical protein